MAERIKGMQIVIGGDTTGLSKALSGVNKKISGTQKELKDVERLLKLDPKNTVLLEQKQKLLAEAVSETREKLESLKKADEQLSESVKNYDKWKAAYDPIQQEFDDTKKKLNDLKQAQKDLGSSNADGYDKIQAEVKETEERLKDLQAQAKKVSDEFGNPISPKQYDALQREIIETEQKMKDLEESAKKANTAISSGSKFTGSLQNGLGKLSSKASAVSSATAPLTAGIAAIGTAAIASVPATEELRSDLSKLDNAARDSGVSVDAARQTWQDFTVATDEADSSVEAVANLLAAGFDESSLQRAMEGITGAYLKFPDTLKIESLADSLQETLATGEATGQLAELIDRLGGSTEAFNEKLQSAATDSEKMALALQFLNDNGLNSNYEAWKKNNEELVAHKDATIEFQEQYAKLAEELLPIITLILNQVSGRLNWFTSLDDETQQFIVTIGLLIAAISPVSGAIGAVSSAISFLIANPIVALIAAIVALVVLIATKGDEIQAILQKVDDFLQNIFATDWRNIFGPVIGDILNAFFANFKNIWDSVKLIFDGIINFIRGVFTGDWERAWKGVGQIFEGVFKWMEAAVKTPINGIIGLLNGAISAINSLINGFNSIDISLPSWLGGGSWSPSIPNIPSIPYLAKGGILQKGSAVVGEAGPELLTMMGNRAMVQPLTSQTQNTTNLGGVNVTVYGAPGQDVRELASIIMDEMESATQRKKAVYA